MNTSSLQALFSSTRQEDQELKYNISIIDEKIAKKEERRVSIENQIKVLKVQKDKLFKNEEKIILQKEVSWKIYLVYKYCTNSSEVDGDPHARGTDYDFQDKRGIFLIEKAQISFKRVKKRFYDKHNFFLTLYCLDTESPLKKIILNTSLSEIGSNGKDDYSNFKITTMDFLTDQDFLKLLSFIKKRNKLD